MFVRAHYQIITKRLQEPRRFVQIVMGPRQVGKSTTVKQVLKDIRTPYLFFSADNIPATNRGWITECWTEARVRMKTEKLDEILLVIDEVQKVVGWSEAVKKEWDADTFSDTNIKVLLLGSSRVMLEKGLADSMAGRFEAIKMPHWSFDEMRQAFGFTLEQYVYYGAYPGAAPLIDEPERWSEYIRSAIIDATINKDILLDSPVGKPALLRQTFELASAYSGEMLSLTKMMGQLQDAGNSTTLSSYLRLLADSGLVCGLHKCAIDKARRRASVPKFQVYNNALRNVFSGVSFEEAQLQPRLWGRMFESAVGCHLINGAYGGRYSVEYWNDGSAEVDFVIGRNGALLPIEVKSNGDNTNKGLQLFCHRFDSVGSLFVGPGGYDPERFLTADPFEML